VSQTPKSFSQTQSEWYDRLEKSGFVDIEDHTQDGRPLKRWSGLSMKRNTLDAVITQPAESPIVSSWPESHLSRAEEFLDRPEFPELCESLCKHRNNAVTEKEAAVIWRMHSDGFSTRSIEAAIGIDHVTVFRMVRRLTEWMNLLENRAE
jgi:hypothetical protein